MRDKMCGTTVAYGSATRSGTGVGGATGGEVIDFAHTVQMRVHEKFGIEIDTEVNIF